MAGEVAAQRAQRVLPPLGHGLESMPQFLLRFRDQPVSLNSISLIR